MSEQPLTIRGVMDELGVSEKTVRRWISNGELEATKDIFGHYKISKEALNDFINRREKRYNQPREK